MLVLNSIHKCTIMHLKLLARVLDLNICEVVNIDVMQFSFVPGKGTTDAIFTVSQLQEEYITANKQLYFAFMDFRKAFDHAPRDALPWALRSLSVEEWVAQHAI